MSLTNLFNLFYVITEIRLSLKPNFWKTEPTHFVTKKGPPTSIAIRSHGALTLITFIYRDFNICFHFTPVKIISLKFHFPIKTRLLQDIFLWYGLFLFQLPTFWSTLSFFWRSLISLSELCGTDKVLSPNTCISM